MATNGKTKVVRLDSYSVGNFDEVPITSVLGIIVEACKELKDQGISVGDRVFVSMGVCEDDPVPHVRALTEDGDDLCCWFPRVKQPTDEWFVLESDDVTIAVQNTTATRSLARMVRTVGDYQRIVMSAREVE